jgi:hypothetical protein
MPGIPSLTFELEIAPLKPKEALGIAGDTIAPDLKELLVRKRWETLHAKSILPLGLRWGVSPVLGLPRMPFSVWRRLRQEQDPIDVSFDAAAVNALHIGGGRFDVPSEPLYILQIRVRNTHPSAAVTVSALDLANRPLPLQTVQVPANSLRLVRFQQPFLGGFSARGGTFTIASVDGVTMKGWIAREQEWELVEIAGLPGTAGEIDGYDPQQQGDPAALEDPPAAARRRIEIAQQFYEDLATSLPSGVVVPLWGIPAPDEALDELRGGTPSLLTRLGDMFHATDTGTLPNQAAFRTQHTVPGIHQPGVPRPGHRGRGARRSAARHCAVQRGDRPVVRDLVGFRHHRLPGVRAYVGSLSPTGYVLRRDARLHGLLHVRVRAGRNTIQARVLRAVASIGLAAGATQSAHPGAVCAQPAAAARRSVVHGGEPHLG